MSQSIIPLVIRGKTIERDLLAFEGRRSGFLRFSSPDVRKYIDDIVLSDPTHMSDLYDISLDEIIDFLCEVGTRLSLSRNAHMQAAFEASRQTSGLTPGILKHLYENSVPALFTRPVLEEMVEHSVGRSYLEGWVSQRLSSGRVLNIRAFGARTVHINAGNNPMVAALSLARNALTRGDAIVKSPSNDPVTAVSLAQTLIELDPQHQITKHFSVAYWKGGDEEFERQLYRNSRIEKIVAWGGPGSMTHITKYLGPGIGLVPMDPKLSLTIIGEEAFKDNATMNSVALRLACDIGGRNQEPCTSARVVFVQSGTYPAGIERLVDLGKAVYEAIQHLPDWASGSHPNFDPVLREEIAGLVVSDCHVVIGAREDRGAIIVSKMSERVDFWERLACRVANLVPVDSLEEVLRYTTVHTGTAGVYPESLKSRVRDEIALRGGQRIVSLGHQNNASVAGPHDALEPMRRMVRWIVDEHVDEEIPGYCRA